MMCNFCEYKTGKKKSKWLKCAGWNSKELENNSGRIVKSHNTQLVEKTASENMTFNSPVVFPIYHNNHKILTNKLFSN